MVDTAGSEEEEKSDEDIAKELLKLIADGLKSRTKHFKVTKPFAEKSVITRSDLLLLGSYVDSYDALQVIDTKLAVDHQNWLNVCGN